uniref:Transposable element P transposase-like RNase H domain-containing protein n=1 Tax=Glossina palpalis gambiensis TaxID=67801 RepID=A0A1B0BNL4_9MUSC
MVFIPDALFSEELKSCPELWGLGKGYVSWKNNGSRLANILTKKTGTLITVEDVKRKWKNVRTYLKRLENTEGTRFTGMGAYVWYAHQLGLERTVARITKQILADGEVPVEVGCEEIKVKEEVQMDTDYEEFLRFDEMDKRLSQEKVTGEQTDLQTNERQFSIESPNIMDYSYNVNRYKNDIDDEKAITSNRITTQILAEGEVPVEVDFEEIKIKEEVQIDTDYEDFLRFDEMDNRFSQEKVTGEQTDVQRNERPSRIESPDVMGYSYNVNRYKNDKDDEKATTSAAAARGRKDRRFEPAVTPDESQEVEEAQRVVPDIEALRGVVGKLTPHDKIVQLHFNEVYTGLRSAYTRSEDKLYGRGYFLNQELAETEEYRTVLVFGVRSILTAFNMLLSAYPIIRHKGNPELLEENLRIAEEIGLEVKAVVCDRSGQNRKAIRIFASGEFKRQRADGSKYVVVHMYDYIHILEAFRQKAITLNRRYDAAIVTKVAAQNAPIWGHWETRGASLLITSPRNLVETVQFFTPAMPAMLEIAIQQEIIAHKYLEPEFAKPKVYDAFHNACDIYKFVILNHMVEANIGKRLQATIVARLAFFREASSCPDGRSHRTNLLGFIINLLLIGDNWNANVFAHHTLRSSIGKLCFKYSKDKKTSISHSMPLKCRLLPILDYNKNQIQLSGRRLIPMKIRYMPKIKK